MMFDLQVPSDATYGKHNILTGTRNDLVVTLPTLVAADFTADVNAAAKITNLRLSAH